ncbi:hypothetical protein [Candidatus Nitrosocosmicus sp. SS]|jgi:hypothetical protein|uniref:hypothetical protein n=1 Tax=Candidatus Nitrosocosmicus agrestis TaxID=2563600 RepID=UPI00122E251B|nr:hypothetical protein [Candidatus Nitrosocosmicus sp. SS]KAA2279361.1 hypothetical protein F1Z66_13675 [Candidatus Nitrosocosmicus sp. SS]KAF0867854.1 hypothetical protein E5N71_13215 [Candidatus Nitrosocosmicus sp. SS]
MVDFSTIYLVLAIEELWNAITYYDEPRHQYLIKIMTRKTTTNLITRRTLLPFPLIFLITFSIMLYLGHLETPVHASIENITDEKNSTLSTADSNAMGDEVGMTFVITNANSNGNSTLAQPNVSSDFSQSSETNLKPSSSPSSSSSSPSSSSSSSQKDNQSTKSNDQGKNNTSSTKTTHTNNMQRGEYKVDDNGIHYYNINNCSEVKGSSGIGDLSECEDAEREMLKER